MMAASNPKHQVPMRNPAEIEQRSQNPFDKGKPGRQTAHKLVRQSGCPTENQPQPEADDDKT